MIKELFRNFYREWLRPPTREARELKRSTLTYYHAQNEAARFGGELFAPAPGYQQAFFWLADNESNPKLGEYVYMKYRVGARKDEIIEMVSHLHYVLTRDSGGRVQVKKYSTLNSPDGSPVYQPVALDELRDLHVAAGLLKGRLKLAWQL